MGFLTRHFPRVSAGANTALRGARLYVANRSLRAWGVLGSHLVRRMFGRPAPAFMTLAPTYRCPCRCVHCYASAPDRPKQEELTTVQIKEIIDRAKRLGLIEVIFSGGDPLLRDDIVELVRYARKRGLLTRINTTGVLLDKGRVAELKAAGLTQCGVSIDHPDPARHDELRGLPGAYDKAVEAIRNLREAGILCQILTYTPRESIPEGVERIIALGRELGVFAVYLFFPMAVGRWDGAFERVLTDGERAAVRALQDLTFVHAELATRHSVCCACRKGVLYVTPEGDVTPCPFVPFVLGNAREHSLDAIWRSHCRSLRLKCRGECPMNERGTREALRNHVESAAGRLR